MLEKILIIVPTFNNPDIIRSFCIKVNELDYSNYNFIFINDTGCQESSEILSNTIFAIEKKSENPLWWAESINMGIEYGLKNKYFGFIFFNDDVELNQKYLDEAWAALRNNPNYIHIPIVLDEENKIWSIGGAASFPFRGEYHISKNSNEPISWAPGMGTVISYSLVEKIGKMRSFFFPQYLSDTDFGLRASKIGIQIKLIDATIKNFTVNTGGICTKSKKNFIKDYFFTFFSKRSPEYLLSRFFFFLLHAPIGLKLVSFFYRFFKLQAYLLKK